MKIKFEWFLFLDKAAVSREAAAELERLQKSKKMTSEAKPNGPDSAASWIIIKHHTDWQYTMALASCLYINHGDQCRNCFVFCDAPYDKEKSLKNALDEYYIRVSIWYSYDF